MKTRRETPFSTHAYREEFCVLDPLCPFVSLFPKFCAQTLGQKTPGVKTERHSIFQGSISKTGSFFISWSRGMQTNSHSATQNCTGF